MPALRDARAVDGGCTRELLGILIFFSLCFRSRPRSDGETGAQCLGKAAPPQGPLKRCLKSFPASPAQQGSAKLRALIVWPQNAATSGGGGTRGVAPGEGEDISSRSAPRPGDSHRAPQSCVWDLGA